VDISVEKTVSKFWQPFFWGKKSAGLPKGKEAGGVHQTLKSKIF
jgi:hypothetical protein